MRIHLDGLTVQSLPGSLTEQGLVEGLIVFVDTWLQPCGPQAEQVHSAGGQRLRGACAEAGPLTLGNVAMTNGLGVSADRLLHCVVVSPDNPHPTGDLMRRCVFAAMRLADEHGLRSVALSPFSVDSNDEGDPVWFAALQAVAALSGHVRHLELVRIIVPPEQSHDNVSMMIVREASRLRHEKGAA